jgi:hypothetical protein
MADTITSNKSAANSSTQETSASVRVDLEEQRKQADSRTRPNIDTERNQVQQDAEQTLDREAIAAIQQTERALNAIAEDRIDEALAAIEQATGKINILLSRNPNTALIPVNLQVTIIDRAPTDPVQIVSLKDAAEIAVDIDDLPAARALLDSLRSEIRVRTYHLPLETYPAALQEAARLLDQKNKSEAASVLLVALNTLAVIDQVTPIPLLLARKAVDDAQALAQTDKEAANKLLNVANDELERTMLLGYTPDDSEYKALREEIKTLRKQLKSGEETGSFFARLKEKFAALTHRQSQKKVHSDAQDQPKKAA